MTEQEWTDKPIPWKPPWAVIRDGESLGMLLHPDGRIFRIQQFGKDGMWGNADDNDEVCASLCVNAMQGIGNPSAVAGLVEALQKIANPLAAIQAEAKASGDQINGSMAIAISNDPEYLKGIARKALTALEQEQSDG